jgi:hypothetical protein
LCNVNIFTEGFDCRDADVAILARPTKSLVLYLQMIGRILRRDQNNQSKTALILDNAMLWKEHGLVSMDREWFLRGGGDIEDDFESYVDENKEVKLRKRKRNPIKEDKNLELQEIDSIVNNNKKKSKRIHVKKFQFTLQFLTKNKIIHEEHIYVKKLPDETKRIENKLGKLTKEKQYDEVVIKTNNNHFIHWKKKKKWMDWKKDTFKYVLIQDSKDRYIWELPKNYLPSSNEKELPLAKVYDNVMAAFTSKLAVQFYNGHVHFTNILFDKPFFISFESPYFCIDFSKFDISFPYKYYKTNIIEGKKRYSNKQSFIEATNQIKRWLEIIDMDH